MVNPVSGAAGVAQNQPTPGQIEAQDDINQAQTALKSGDYAKALELYQAACKADPAVAPDLKSAIAALTKQVQLEKYLNEANEALQNKDYPAALGLYEKVSQIDPDMAKQLQSTISQLKGQIDINNANAAQAKNDLPGMIKWYTQAAQDDPSMASELQPTITQLTSQNQFNQDWPNIVNALNAAGTVAGGNLLEGQGPEAALNILQGVLNKYPDTAQYYPNIYLQMAQIAFGGSNIDQAREYMSKLSPEQLQQMAQQDPQTDAQIAQLHQQLYGNALGNWTQYLSSDLGKALGTNPNWINNVLLSNLSQIMPNVMNQPKEVFKGYMPGEYSYVRSRSEHGIKETEQQIKAIQEQINETSDPKEHQALEAQKAQLEQKADLMRQAKAEEYKEFSPAQEAVGTKTTYTRRGEVDETVTTTNSAEAPKQNQDTDEKFQTSGHGGPGYWGMGQTLAEAKHYLDTLGSVNLQSTGGGELKSRSSYFGGQTRFGDADARAADMIYTSSQGFHVGLLGQARAALLAGDYQAQINEGNVTIGGQSFNSQTQGLSTASASGSYQVLGTQADADVNASLTNKGLSLGGGAGAFAAVASASGQVGASTLGGAVSLSLCGQAWAGAGAKVHANFSLSENDIGFNCGIGLGPFYIQPMVNINLDALGQDFAAIYGTGQHKFTGMAKRTGQLLADSAATLGDAVSHGASDLTQGFEKAQDYISDQADANMKAGGVKTLESIGEEAGEAALDGIEYMTEPWLAAGKEIGKDVSKVGSDFAKGEIGKGLKDAVVGTAKAAVNMVKDVATAAWHGIKKLFSWL